MTFRPLPLFAVAALPLLGVAQALASEPVTAERTLVVSGPVMLDVRSDPGGVIVTVGSSTAVVVHAFIKPLYGRLDFDLAEANILSLQKDLPVEQNGNSIRVGYTDPSRLRAVSVRYEVEVPKNTQVKALTESGGIRVTGVAGPVETATQSGATEVRDVQGAVTITGHSGAESARNIGGNVTVRNSSGGIEVAGVRGSVQAETTSGRTEISDVTGAVRSATRSASIRIDGAKDQVDALNTSGSIDVSQSGGAIHAETTSGAIRISQNSPAAIRALAGSGSIRVALVSGAGYQLDALSKSGKVSGRATESFPKTRDNHSLKAQIGPGGPLVDLDTRSSKIEID